MDTPFILEEVYQVPKEKVWKALTDAGSLRQWYFPQLLQFEPVTGFEFKFADDGSPYQKKWQVTQVESGTVLAHNWAYDGYPGQSEVTFELSGSGQKTKLRLSHTGLASFPKDPHFARARFENGWKTILGRNLRNYLERKKNEAGG
jgi:uncharacterized protein YndB with AHSA1/START domain